MSKTTFKRLLQNQVLIDYDIENYDYYDDSGDNFYEDGDENDQKPERFYWFLLKIYPSY